jgi:trehalose 6-phosphate phosphatase
VTPASARHTAIDDFAALDPRAVALLLDVDGTLIDLGPSPFEVHVPPELCRSLERLLAASGGALALVSGRPIRDLDTLFVPLALPAVGGHGAEMRVHAGEEVSAAADALPEAMRAQLAQAKALANGIEIEDKGYSFALHFRKAPRAEDRLRTTIAAARAAFPDEAVEVLPGKAMFEVKRPGISKGAAVRALMTRAPFAGRTPVFVGDDVTDESVFALLPALRGKGFSVGRRFENVSGLFHSPDEVRTALQRLAAKGRASAP